MISEVFIVLVLAPTELGILSSCGKALDGMGFLNSVKSYKALVVVATHPVLIHLFIQIFTSSMNCPLNCAWHKGGTVPAIMKLMVHGREGNRK